MGERQASAQDLMSFASPAPKARPQAPNPSSDLESLNFNNNHGVVGRLKAVQSLYRGAGEQGEAPPPPLPRTLLPSHHPAGGLQYPDPNKPNSGKHFPHLAAVGQQGSPLAQLYRQGQPASLSALYPAQLQPAAQATALARSPSLSAASMPKSSSWQEDLGRREQPATSTPKRPNSIASQPRGHLESKVKEEVKMRTTLPSSLKRDPTSLIEFDSSKVMCMKFMKFILLS